MTALGDVLELLHRGAPDGVSVRVVAREWRHCARSERAFWRWHEASGGTMLADVRPTPADSPAETTCELRVWIEGDRVREERASAQGDRVAVQVGDAWWLWSPWDGALTNEGATDHRYAIADAVDHLLEPAALPGELVLEPLGETTVAGRPALLARALPRRPRGNRFQSLAPRLGLGADAWELAVDREHGVLLRVTAFHEGEPFQETLVTEIAFGEALAEGTFTFVPPAGEEVRSVTATQAVTTLHEAAAAAGFTVLAPTIVPADWRLHVTRIEPRSRPPLHESVHLHYGSPEGAVSVTVSQCAATEPAGEEWLPWRAEQDVEVAELEHGSPARWLRLTRDGTRVTLNGDLELELLLALARSLAPAPTEPPTLSG